MIQYRKPTQNVSSLRGRILAVTVILLCAVLIPSPAHAAEYSMPVLGRWARPMITLAIPATPRWAHDVVVNASLVWNRAQVWFQRIFVPAGNTYSFLESNVGNASVSFSVPSKYASFAVGWTDFTFARSSTSILGAHVYLDQGVFNDAQMANVTARQYAFRLALHELGHVLGLGNLLDGQDIMDPLRTPNRAAETPMLSTLDLFAVYALASNSSLTSSFITLNTDQYELVNASTFLAGANIPSTFPASQPYTVPTTLCELRVHRFKVCRG